MALHLDARQRAMLQEMGITVWLPGPADVRPAAQPSAPESPPPASVAPPRATPPAAAPASALAPPAATAPRPQAAPSALPTPTTAAAGDWSLHPHAPQPAYTEPTGPGPRWLVVLECADPAAPLAGDTGRLLDQMLRALAWPGLPDAHLLALERRPSAAAPGGAGHATLQAAIAALAPQAVLLLGHVAARWALERSEPLGHLRAGPHTLAGVPAVVSYDPAFLLRSPATKAAAWADLCNGLALVQAAPPAAAP